MRSGRFIALAAAGALMVGGLGLGSSVGNASAEGVGPSEAVDWAGEFAEDAYEIFEAVENCKANKENNLPCSQSTATTVDEIYSTLNNFISAYNVDQGQTEQALSAIITELQQSNLTNRWTTVSPDLTKAQRMFTILTAWVTCSKAFADAPAGSTATCQASDVNGVLTEQPATTQVLNSLSQELVAVDTAAPGTQAVPWQYDYQTLLPYVSGSVSNPYDTNDTSLLHAIVTAKQSAEVSKQDLTPGSTLRFYSASYVNTVGEAVAYAINLESMYMMSRIAAFSIEAQQSTDANTKQYLNSDAADLQAQMTGRNADGSPATLVAPTPQTQLAAYTFPGWTPTKPLAPNQAYFTGPNTAPVLLTNLGNSTSSPSVGNGVPTATEMQNIASDFGINPNQGRQSSQAGGPYAFLSKLYPSALPLRTDATIPGDTSVGRWWSVPETTWDTHETNTTAPVRYTGSGTENLNDSPQPVTVLGTNFSIWGHPLTGSELAHVSQLQQTPIAYNIYARATDTQGDAGWMGNSGGAAPLELLGTPFAPLLAVDPQNAPGSFGGPVYTGDSRLVAPTTKYPVGFVAPVWDTYGTAGGGLGAVSSTFGAGLLVRTGGVEAANVTLQPIEASGALQSSLAAASN